MRSIIAGALGLAALASAGLAWGQSQQTVTFGCDAQGSDVCYFSILPASGGIVNFTLGAGQRDQRSGMWPGRDSYLVTINRSTPADWGRCVRQEGGWCKAAVVQPGYNN